MSQRQQKKIGEIINLNYGKGIDKSERNENLQNPIYGANGILNYTNNFLYEGDSIIIGRKGSAGALTRVSGKFRPSDVTYYVTKKLPIDIDYLFYGLHTLNIPTLAQGVKPGINRNDVHGLNILYPPLATQQKIVAKLDEISTTITQAKTQIENQLSALEECWQSSLSESFDNEEWKNRKLSDVCLIERGGSPRPIQKFLTEEKDGVNRIKIGDTKNQVKYISYTAEKIKPEGVKRSRMVYPGDFILSNSMSFGKPYIMQTEGCIHDGRLVLRTDQTINKDFMYFLLGSPFMYSKFEQTATGTGVKNLNIQKVKEVQIPLPPLEKQEEIVTHLNQLHENISTLKQQYQTQLTHYDELRASVLDQAFKGELIEE
ncbi:MAG: restriction endonuclease subunit S [Candidatus Absconditabacteria bacterium]|nr:restriction endonuclease subunit S [Candidatus Absconditabacteria bacterium]MDD4713871.1 restriction endonuclease subunit S [Candidatus Absconditabacteria bacterium]